MPQPFEQIIKDLMDNPDFHSFPGKTKGESAWEAAWKKFRQSENNNMALSLSKQDIPSKSNLTFDKISHRWKKPENHHIYSNESKWSCKDCKGIKKNFSDMASLTQHRHSEHGTENNKSPNLKKFVNWVKRYGH